MMTKESLSKPKSAHEQSGLSQILAIDGPAGAGKSSVTREVAKRLGMAFLDSGAMYRAATWWAMHQGLDMNDPEELARFTEELPLDMHADGTTLRVIVDGHDVSEEIRTPQVTRNIKFLDGIQEVRTPLVRLQRAFASRQPTVSEGRDMGTVVFPDARCKIYLDASIEERTRRRAAQLDEQGTDYDLDALRAEIRDRDTNDMTRGVAPLQKAADASVLDTSSLSLEEVVLEVIRLAKAAL